ncbi:MAG TPA: carboxypeptidase-like regulatory domain-containing protein [Terriglobales bacterium]|nr:carboxypeptidase-like regulatory domain-containing protein [Terriglobales bacterium]
MSRSIGALLLVFFCLERLSADPQFAIIGQITDSEGAAIASARVLVHWDASGSAVGHTDNIGVKQDLIVVTDAGGRYSANVPAGFYDVFVSAPAFTPIAAKVIVKQGQKTMLNAKLYLDPLVSKEIGGMQVEGVR